MNGLIKKKEIEENEIALVLELHNSLLNDNRTVLQWKHQYLDYLSESSVFTILKDKKKVVGTQGMIPFYLMIDGKHLSGKSENSLLDPNYRGGRAFQELYEFAIDLCKSKKMRIIWGFTSAVYVWRKKLNFNVYEGVMYQAIRIINLKAAIHDSFTSFNQSKRNKLIKLGLIILSPIFLLGIKIKSSFQHMFYLGRSQRTNSIIIKTHLDSNNDIKKFFQRAKECYPNLIYINQDIDFINWRIYHNPNLKYTTYFAYNNDILVGYCYSTVNQKLGRGYLTDFTFEDSIAGKILLKRILSDFKKEKISFVIFYGNFENPLVKKTWKLLKKAGFSNKKNQMAVVIKNIGIEKNKQIDDIKNWHMTGLWTEGYNM